MEGSENLENSKNNQKSLEPTFIPIPASSSTSTEDANQYQVLIPTVGKNSQRCLVTNYEDESVGSALLNFFLIVFSPLWTVSMVFFHLQGEDQNGGPTLNLTLKSFDDIRVEIDLDPKSAMTSPAFLSTAILAVHFVILHAVYWIPKSSPKHDLWKGSKFFYLICAIPGLPALSLAFCNCIFAMKEANSRSYSRPWSNTRYIFLAESLSLPFPLAIIHFVWLVENPEVVHTLSGYVAIGGILVFLFSMTFARFRRDAVQKHDRFGTGFDKLLRFVILGANKALWLITFTITFLNFRMIFPGRIFLSSSTSIFLILLSLEGPVLLFLRCLSRSSSIPKLMMWPQFVSLSVFLLWCNLDHGIYSSDSGSLAMGLFFWAEVLILSGWLYDGCTGREVDFIPYYPHLFVDVYTNFA